MNTTSVALRAMAAACAAVIAAFAFAGSAFAATVHGADCHSAGSAIESGQIDVLNVDGSAGETVFLSVKRGGETLAKNLPYTIGEGSDSSEGGSWAGVATLDIDGLDTGAFDGAYTVEAYATRAGGTPIYTGAIYGVYADLPDKTTVLIGTRTANESELSARSFEPTETLYIGGKTYRLEGEGTSDGGVLHYSYVAYDEANTVDGVVKYVDASGAVVATAKIPGLARDEKRTVSIPSVITGDNGDLYRTVFFKDSVTAVNPGQTSFSVYCAKMSDAAKALSGYYVASIKMVDESGDVIATDSVDVTGEFVYTAPSTIFKTETDASTGDSEVVAYRISQSGTIRLSAANDGVLDRVRTITVSYATEKLAKANEVEVTFNLIDGSKRVNEEGRNLGTRQLVATKDAPSVEPDSELVVDGATFHIAGDASDYAYTLHSGEVPSVDVYYTPEGYRASEAYNVTVNYVNVLTDEVVESHSYTSDAGENSRITIDTPEAFSANGADYVRLAGQENAIAHSYYSGISAYTVYYRNANDELTGPAVINKMRVVYEDAEPGTASSTTATSTTSATEQASSTSQTIASDADSAADSAAQALQLNNARTYNVLDGADSNATLTNESGVDSNTERIEDSETPLASGFDRGASSSAASSFMGMSQWLLPVGIGIVAVGVVAIVVTVVRRKREED